MSAFNDLAAPAPEVEAATAERAESSGPLTVEPAIPSEDAIVEPAKSVEPAETFDDPKKFGPAFTKEAASALSVAALRQTGADFESQVRETTTIHFFSISPNLYSFLFVFVIYSFFFAHNKTQIPSIDHLTCFFDSRLLLNLKQYLGTKNRRLF